MVKWHNDQNTIMEKFSSLSCLKYTCPLVSFHPSICWYWIAWAVFTGMDTFKLEAVAEEVETSIFVTKKIRWRFLALFFFSFNFSDFFLNIFSFNSWGTAFKLKPYEKNLNTNENAPTDVQLLVPQATLLKDMCWNIQLVRTPYVVSILRSELKCFVYVRILSSL